MPILFVAVLPSSFVCGAEKGKESCVKSMFGKTADGQRIELYTITNRQGVEVQVMNYGATIVSVKTPDRDGKLDNITLGLDTFEDYAKGHPALGSTIGRFANRIGGSGFTIDGTRYDLDSCNRAGVQIHGGRSGFGKQIWDARHEVIPGFGAMVEFSIESSDGQEGFPGTVKAIARFMLINLGDHLLVEYFAETDKPTHVNLTNHAYWNLGGAGNGDVLDHVLTIDAESYLELDEHQVPTGKILPVAGTPLDFRDPHKIGERIGQTSGGYDHCYVLWTDKAPEEPRDAALLVNPKTGRTLRVRTTQPGVQIYTANGLSDRFSWQGKPYGKYHGVCFETQHFPDAPNKPNFPSTLLRPGEKYHHRAVFTFGVEKEGQP
jgi:aldose 1-epimerase